MSKFSYKLTRSYLTHAVKKFNLNDIASTRIKFDNLSNDRLKPKVQSITDIDTPNSNIRVRIYRNSNVKSDNTVVFFHGGGFVLGSIESHDSICRHITRSTGATVISVNYTRAPEAQYPAQIYEGLTVLKWIKQSANELQVNLGRIFLVGDSAGGSIVRDVAINPDLPITPKGLILIYPSLDPRLETQSMEEYATGHFLTKEMLIQFWDLYLGAKKYHFATNSEVLKLPPVLIVAANNDVLRDEGEVFAEQLRSLKKSVEYVIYEDTLHGFMHHPKVISEKSAALEQIKKFIASN